MLCVNTEQPAFVLAQVPCVWDSLHLVLALVSLSLGANPPVRSCGRLMLYSAKTCQFSPKTASYSQQLPPSRLYVCVDTCACVCVGSVRQCCFSYTVHDFGLCGGADVINAYVCGCVCACVCLISLASN